MTLTAELESKWRAWQGERAAKEGRPARDPAASAGVPDLLYVLRAAGQLAVQHTTSIEGLTKARNKSIAAHGMQPVSAEHARGALDQARGLLEALFPNESRADPPNEYAFAAGALDAIGGRLFSVLANVE